jgi:hypothetical protein
MLKAPQAASQGRGAEHDLAEALAGLHAGVRLGRALQREHLRTQREDGKRGRDATWRYLSGGPQHNAKEMRVHGLPVMVQPAWRRSSTCCQPDLLLL